MDNLRKPTVNFWQLLQKWFETSYPRSKLNAEEAKRLKKLEAIADKLKRGENVQNLQLQTCLNKDDYT